MKERYDFSDFLEIINILRGENGCPWDKVQTHDSLKLAMLEEAYEAVDAIENRDSINLCEELGDVLLQVVFHAAIGKEQDGFTIDDVIDGISKKMIKRHGHIFGDDEAKTPEAVLDAWEKTKKKEKGYKSYTEAMKAVPKAMPALIRAEKVQAKAAGCGFDFDNFEQAFEKVKEEVCELSDSVYKNRGNIEEELGDILFSVVNISRFLKLNPEFSLTKSTEKFINRFEHVESMAETQGKALASMTMNEMDELWHMAKEL